MKKINYLFFLFFTISFLAQNTNSKPYIEVTGTSEIEVIPDEIYLDISLKERSEKGKKLTISILENQLKSALKEIGIPEGNLSISDINNILSKTGLWKKEILSFTNYSLKVNGVNKLKKLFDSFKKLKVFSVNITKTTHSDIIGLKKKNRIKAINAAKEKSDYLLSTIGKETGNPLIVNEINLLNKENYRNNNINIRGLSSNYKYYDYNVTGYGAIKKSMEFKKIKITSSIYVKFSIK